MLTGCIIHSLIQLQKQELNMEGDTQQSYPWFISIIPNQGKPPSCYSYNLINQEEYVSDVGIGSRYMTWTCCYNWLVLQDYNEARLFDNIRKFSLFHMASKKEIKLPAMYLLNPWHYSYILLTAPPTSIDCTFVVFSPENSTLLVWRLGQQNWGKVMCGSQIRLSHLKVCNHRIYGIVDLKYFAVFDIVNDTFTVKILGSSPFESTREYGNSNRIRKIDQGFEYYKVFDIVNVDEDDEEVNDEAVEEVEEEYDENYEEYDEGYEVDADYEEDEEYDEGWEVEEEDDDTYQHLVGYRDDIFFVQISVIGLQMIESINIYKFDKTNMEWTKIKNIGDDCAILLNGRHSYSCCTKNSYLRGNTIYFLDEERPCIFNIETGRIDIHTAPLKPYMSDMAYLMYCEKWF